MASCVYTIYAAKAIFTGPEDGLIIRTGGIGQVDVVSVPVPLTVPLTNNGQSPRQPNLSCLGDLYLIKDSVE